MSTAPTPPAAPSGLCGYRFSLLTLLSIFFIAFYGLIVFSFFVSDWDLPYVSSARKSHDFTEPNVVVLQAFRRYLRDKRGIDDSKVWAAIKDTTVRTILSAEPKVYTQIKLQGAEGRAYEIWGVDILLDEHLTPWLVEVSTDNAWK